MLANSRSINGHTDNKSVVGGQTKNIKENDKGLIKWVTSTRRVSESNVKGSDK